jgi:hypothetical protein
MVLTFYLGVAALEFKQYAAYVQRRTATRELGVEVQPRSGRQGVHGNQVHPGRGSVGDDGSFEVVYRPTFTHTVFSR